MRGAPVVDLAMDASWIRLWLILNEGTCTQVMTSAEQESMTGKLKDPAPRYFASREILQGPTSDIARLPRN